MGTLTDLFNNIDLFTFISFVSLTIDINFEKLFHYIILSAINKNVIPLLNSEFITSASVSPIYYIYNSPSSKPEKLRSSSLNEKRVPYKLRSKCSAHSNIPR
jgi:hypothetical protein